MAWKVNSVVARPSSPASNFIVGVQTPKSRPEMVEASKPGLTPVTALEEAAAAPVPVALPVAVDEEALVTATAALVEVEEAGRVTVTKVVEPPVQVTLAAELTVAAISTVLEEATIETDEDKATEATADPEAMDPVVPSAALVVKLEKP